MNMIIIISQLMCYKEGSVRILISGDNYDDDNDDDDMCMKF